LCIEDEVKKPLLEIFVLSFNRADYLRDCLRSILNQTFTDFTVTVLDNHSDSKQNIEEVVASFQDVRLRLIVNSTNIGGPANWTQAHDMASSDFMVIFHDDDCMSPRMLERQIQLFNMYPKLSQVSAGVNFVYHHENMLYFNDVDDLQYKIFETPSALVHGYLFDKEGFSFGSIMYRTCFAKQVRLDTARFANVADRPYVLAVTALGPFVRMSRPIYNVRVHSEQDSGTGTTWSYLNEIELGQYYLETTRGAHTRLLRHAVMRIIIENYIIRQPRVPLVEWLKALRKKHMLFVVHLIVLLMRNLLKRQIIRLVPDKYYQNLRSCIRGT
jgi:glycosyltransferase involved in cell wall biosynthesis